MLIATNSDALQALLQLNNDLQDTAQKLAGAAVYVDEQNNLPGAIGLGASLYNSGAEDLTGQAAQLVLGLEQDVVTEMSQFDGSSTPITDQQRTDLQNLQQLVIQARSAVNSTISTVDWTFGSLASDAVTIVQNTASQAAGAISKALGINWTYVEIGGAVVAAVLVYALFLRVRG